MSTYSWVYYRAEDYPRESANRKAYWLKLADQLVKTGLRVQVLFSDSGSVYLQVATPRQTQTQYMVQVRISNHEAPPACAAVQDIMIDIRDPEPLNQVVGWIHGKLKTKAPARRRRKDREKPDRFQPKGRKQAEEVNLELTTDDHISAIVGPYRRT